ncbi:unnamed protein product [Calypogeia fissa]
MCLGVGFGVKKGNGYGAHVDRGNEDRGGSTREWRRIRTGFLVFFGQTLTEGTGGCANGKVRDGGVELLERRADWGRRDMAWGNSGVRRRLIGRWADGASNSVLFWRLS